MQLQGVMIRHYKDKINNKKRISNKKRLKLLRKRSVINNRRVRKTLRLSCNHSISISISQLDKLSLCLRLT